jgi:hypothetical protein
MITFLFCFLAAGTGFGANGPSSGARRQSPQKDEKAPPITIISIIPAQGEPGTTITLYGSGFSDKTVALLGSQEAPSRMIGPKQFAFQAPQLSPGLYALFLKREDGVTSKTYNFTLLPLKPVITDLNPSTIDACATGSAREVSISGRNFQEGSHVMFDGAMIKSRRLSAELISFSIPHVSGGQHQVQVRGPLETSSDTVALFIDARPEVESVTKGVEYVNYYELIIEGRNFQQGSSVIVDGRKLAGGGMAEPGARERIIFHNCNRLIYLRHPYDPSQKSFHLQVINPDNGESSVVTVDAP